MQRPRSHRRGSQVRTGLPEVLRDRARDRCCDALAAVPASAPTLCEGWTAFDLAVHLWTLQCDPLGWAGTLPLGRAKAYGEKRAAAVQAAMPYDRVLAKLRDLPGSFPCMPLDPFFGYRHALGEWYVHTQDVARANGLTQPDVDAPLAEALWLRAQAAARILHPRIRGLRFQRPDGSQAVVNRGATTLTVIGEPSEIMCWVYGRVADVALQPA